MALWRKPPSGPSPLPSDAPGDPRAELLRQMRALRERIDPAVLDRVAEVASRSTIAPSASGAVPPRAPVGDVPYDKVAARAVVENFLRERHDGGRFALKLMAELKKSTP